MKRYYSHYTFIYPDVYLKNSIVEMDDNQRIIRVFPFANEVEKTEFYSGVLLFLPEGLPFDREMFEDVKKRDVLTEHPQWEDVRYKMYIED